MGEEGNLMDEAENASALRVGLLAPLESFDPRGAWEMGRALVASQIFETPYAVRGSLDAEPVVFDAPMRETTTPSGKPVYSAGLRPGIRFSDGSSLSAAEAAAILGRSQILSGQVEVTAIDERIFFELRRPNSRFDLALTSLDCAIVRERGQDLLGTGPYAAAPPLADGTVRLVRNPHYDRPVAIPEIHFKVYPPDPDGSPRSLLAAIERGEVDFSSVLSLEQQRPLRGARKHNVPGNSTAILFFNTESLPDPEVRLAIATAIDRRAVARQVYSDPLTIANHTAKGLLPPMLGWSLDGIVFDPEKARQLLSRARGPVPKRLTLLVIWSPRAYLPQPSLVAETLAEQLAEIGFSVKVELSTGAEDLERRIVAGSFDLYLGGWIADTPDPADFLEVLLSSQAIPRAGRMKANQANFSRWSQPATDRALERLREHQTDSDRNRLLLEIAEQVPVFPLLYGPATAVVARRIEGFSLFAIGHPSFAELRIAG